MKKRWVQWLAILMVFSLLAACGNAGNYIKDNYSLIDVQGQGKNTAKIYSVEGKDVPTVAKELANNENPKETSKESADQMFLVYDNKIINLQKDPNNASNTLVELDSIEYAKQNYDSSFLQGYIAASLLQSLFGGGWSNNRGSSDYRGYTSSQRYNDYGKYQASPDASSKSGSSATKPSTTEGKGSFSTGSKATTPPTSSGSTGSSSSGSNIRKNDGSTPTYKAPSSSSKSSPSTSTRSGSFKKK